MSAALREPATGYESDRCVHDLAQRNALITQYRPYVHKVARSVAAQLGLRGNTEDLASWGYLGLIEAAERFDPARGVSFRTFAHTRIRGAVLDGLRLERGGSHRLARRMRSYHELVDGLRETMLDGGYVSGMEAPPREVHRCFDSPDRHLWLVELRDRLENALSILTPLERDLVENRYLRDRSLQSYAAERRMSKSWFSRLHKRALVKMRLQLLRSAAAGRAS